MDRDSKESVTMPKIIWISGKAQLTAAQIVVLRAGLDRHDIDGSAKS